MKRRIESNKEEKIKKNCEKDERAGRRLRRAKGDKKDKKKED